MESKIKLQKCGICSNNVSANPRYPNYICYECVQSGTFTEDGESIEFYNIDF